MFASPLAPDQAAHFLKLIPDQSLPVPVENGVPLWEADAIVCRLSQLVASNFWRQGAAQPDMIR